MFYYETNILGLNPNNLGLIDFTSNLTIIIVIKFYDNFLYKYNFKLITFVIRILIFGSFSLIYLLINKITQEYINDFILLCFATSLYAGLHSLGQLPYNFLCIKYSPFGLEATTFSFSVSSSYLGNIFSDFIDYSFTIYFNVTHYNFSNFGKLVIVENILNLIPLLYIWIIPKNFFSTKNINLSQSSELSSVEKKNDNNNNNDIEKKEEESDNKNNENLINNILKNFVEDEDDENNIENNNQEISNIHDSYRYLAF